MKNMKTVIHKLCCIKFTRFKIQQATTEHHDPEKAQNNTASSKEENQSGPAATKREAILPGVAVTSNLVYIRSATYFRRESIGFPELVGFSIPLLLLILIRAR